MQKKQLGNSDLTISRVGFGAWAISGADWQFSWGAQDDADSVAAIHRAVELGVNWIDTAAAYGNGHSEEVVGRALRALPEADRPYVFTKTGVVWDDGDHSRPARRLMSRASVRKEVEESLRRLDVERIDLYQVHWPGDGKLLVWGADQPADDADLATPLAEYWATMRELVDEGKVRAIGLSNHSREQIAEAEKVAHVDASQPPFSALERGYAEDIAWSEGNGTGVIVYSPMASGLLTGAFDAARVAALPVDDWRRAAPDFTDRLDANLAVAGALARVAGRHGVSTAAAAVAWTLAWPGLTGAIVGARKASQVDGWVAAANLRLTAEDLDEVAAVLRATGAGVGPVRP
ncbi:aldo/keto reductase [Actinorhabdospora filicis]|uniref:Aldo/keto reductase n=1 Tax=Actinorhabdospora filicis TaxID=1785913 RepID=A0A9W6W5K8_9ACTN|nr:aldo/keto reductase [Actinorhabdospora filicis]GLZ80497.1 aldo/keto reductase [Actinorhabdospora filicis]